MGERGAGTTRRGLYLTAAGAFLAFALAATGSFAAGWRLADDADEVASLKADVVDLERAMARADERRAGLETSLDQTRAELSTTKGDLIDEKARANRAEDAAAALRLEYDPQIRAEAQGQHDGALAAACTSAVESGAPDYAALATSHFDSAWGDILEVSKQGFQSAIEGCAAPELAKSFRERCTAVPDVETIQKDPDAFEGQCFVIVTEVTQFDSATGECGFRGYWDTRAREYNFEYAGDNAVFSAEQPCPALGPVGQDDVVRVWATVSGSFSYSTTIGGQAHAVGFDVGDAELLVDN